MATSSTLSMENGLSGGDLEASSCPTDDVVASGRGSKDVVDDRPRRRLCGVPIPPVVSSQLDSFLDGLKTFLPDLPDKALPLRHVELVLRALELDPSPVDLETMAASTGYCSEDFVENDIYYCIEYFMQRKSNPLELVRAYSQFDLEGKGFISLEDMRRASAVAGEDMSDVELQELIDAADESKNGFVSKEDFFKFIQEVHLSLKDF